MPITKWSRHKIYADKKDGENLGEKSSAHSKDTNDFIWVGGRPYYYPLVIINEVPVRIQFSENSQFGEKALFPFTFLYQHAPEHKGETLQSLD